jgi:phosphoribosylglycinamide formyltransferase-1
MLTDVLHVAVLCSERAPGLDALLHHPQRGIMYDVECVISSAPLFPECGVPVVTHPIREFFDERLATLKDQTVRRCYDSATRQFLHYLGVNVVVMLGYLYIVSEPLLEAFDGRILNVHDGLPKYPGLHATRDAIANGETSTYSIVHVATAEVDAGPIVRRSDPFPVAQFAHEAALAGEDDIVRAYAYAHREWKMRSSWGNLVAQSLEVMATREELVAL